MQVRLPQLHVSLFGDTTSLDVEPEGEHPDEQRRRDEGTDRAAGRLRPSVTTPPSDV
jgi:hypothetical protein